MYFSWQPHITTTNGKYFSTPYGGHTLPRLPLLVDGAPLQLVFFLLSPQNPISGRVITPRHFHEICYPVVPVSPSASQAGIVTSFLFLFLSNEMVLIDPLLR
ncbi:hypothetical protein IC582_018618 [Cucumis melo]